MSRVGLDLHRCVLGAWAIWFFATVLVFFLWCKTAFEPLESFYLPTYVQTGVLGMVSDKERPYPVLMLGGMLLTQSMFDQNPPGVLYKVKQYPPADLHQELQAKIYRGSLLDRFLIPALISGTVLLVLVPWGWWVDSKRLAAMRGAGWQEKGRLVLKPNQQGRRADKGGLEIWTEN